MEQDERTVVHPSNGDTEQGREALATALAVKLAGADEVEQERVSETDDSVRPSASEGSKKQDLEVTHGDSARCATRKNENEDGEAFQDNNATHFEFRAVAAEAPPLSACRRAWSRGKKQAGLSEFVAAGDAEDAGSRYPVLGASSSSGPATGTHEHVSVMAGGDHGAEPEHSRKLKRACSAPGATVAIAHASPPDSYRRVPSRSRKQYSPKRFIAAPHASHPPLPAAILGPALPSASSSKRPPSRGRKQPRPEHFIPEEAEATASAKARRSGIILDRFVSTQVLGSTASEWVRNVTAQDAAVRGERQRGGEGFRIRDASLHATRSALSRLGCASPSSSSAAAGSPPGEPGGKGRFYGVLAVLGASLALSVVSCVLIYIVGPRSDAGPSGEKPAE